MSTTFFAPDAQAATEHLSFNLSESNAGELVVFVGLDTIPQIVERGMVAGEASGAEIKAAIMSALAACVPPTAYLAMRLYELHDLAEAAETHGATVSWA